MGITPSESDVIAIVADELADAQAQGDAYDVEAAVARYPAYGTKIRQTLQLLMSVASLEAGTALDDGPPEPTPFATEKAIGDFRIVRQLGQGGMGIVYEAVQQSIGRSVALKVLPFAAMSDGKQLQRFQNEVRAVGTLHHPNIVPIYAVGVERGVHYFAMQYVNGPSLDSILNALQSRQTQRQDPQPDDTETNEDQPRIPDSADTRVDLQALISTRHDTDRLEYHRVVATWIAQAADALAHAHERGVLHRDIKPANLLIDEYENLWVADFGLAKLSQDESITQTGDVLGTYRYMAPETVSGHRVLIDHRADIYALGATLYELLTLLPLVRESNRQRIAEAISSQPPESPTLIDRSIPKDLETIVLKAVSKDPNDRYASADEFASDLRRFTKNESISARPPSRMKRTQQWAKLHPRRAIRLVASAALLSLSLAVVWYFNLRRIESAKEHVTAGKAYAASERYDAAKVEFEIALQELKSTSQQQSPLVTELNELIPDVSARNKAQRTRERLTEIHSSIMEKLYVVPPGLLADFRDECRQAIDLFDLFKRKELTSHPSFRCLEKRDQASVKRELQELTFLWALSGIDRSHDTADELSASHREAISALELLAKLNGPFPAASLWSALSHEHLGNHDRARAMKVKAMELSSRDSFEWFALGKYYDLQRDHAQAIECFQQSLQMDTRNLMAILSFAQTVRELAEYEDVFDEPKQVGLRLQQEALSTAALALNPDCAAAYICRAYARDDLKGERGPLALSDLQKAESKSPASLGLMIHRASLLGRRGSKEDCYRLFAKAGSQCGEDIPAVPYWHAHWILASSERGLSTSVLDETYDLLTKTLTALPEIQMPAKGALYRQAYDVQAMRLSTLLRRAAVQRIRGNPKKSEADLALAVAIEPVADTQRFLRAIALLMNGQLERGRTQIEKLEFNEVRRWTCSEELVVLARLLKDVDLIDNISAAIPKRTLAAYDQDAIDRCRAEVRIWKACSLIRRNKRSDAITLFREAADVQPEDPTPRLFLAESLSDDKQFREAVDQLDVAIAKFQALGRESYAGAFYHRSVAHLALGEYVKALRDAQSAIAMNPTHLPFYDHAVKVCQRQEEWAAAVKEVKALFNQSAELGHPNDTAFGCWLDLAPELVIEGNGELYRDVCRDLIREIEGSKLTPVQLEKFIKSCLLTADAVAIETMPAEQLIEAIDSKKFSDSMIGWAEASYALVLLRDHKFREASRRSQSQLRRATGRLETIHLAILALAEIQLGQSTSGRETLGLAIARVDEEAAKGDKRHRDILIPRILVREARDILALE